MHYAFVGYDKPNGLERRLAIRPDHFKHLESLGEALLMAGPFFDEKGDMVGSFMVIEAESLAEAEAIYARDPYVVNRVFDTMTIKPWRLTINNLPK